MTCDFVNYVYLYVVDENNLRLSFGESVLLLEPAECHLRKSILHTDLFSQEKFRRF